MLRINPLTDAKYRYQIGLGAEVAIAASIIGLLMWLNIRELPVSISKIHQTNVFFATSTLKQDLTVTYSETGRWPLTQEIERSNVFGGDTVIEKIDFDGNGGLHLTFNAQDPHLSGKTLSFRAATSRNTFSGNTIWSCGFQEPPEGYAIDSVNRTNLPHELTFSICKESLGPSTKLFQ